LTGSHLNRPPISPLPFGVCRYQRAAQDYQFWNGWHGCGDLPGLHTAHLLEMIGSTSCRNSRMSLRSGPTEPRLLANVFGACQRRELYLYYRVVMHLRSLLVHADFFGLRKTGGWMSSTSCFGQRPRGPEAQEHAKIEPNFQRRSPGGRPWGRPDQTRSHFSLRTTDAATGHRKRKVPGIANVGHQKNDERRRENIRSHCGIRKSATAAEITPTYHTTGAAP
jgi:hypothetical protein